MSLSIPLDRHEWSRVLCPSTPGRLYPSEDILETTVLVGIL